MKGAFTCPYCKTENACNCPTCEPHINEGEYINKWTEDGENLICGKCDKVYSPDQALDEEWKMRNELKQKEELVEKFKDKINNTQNIDPDFNDLISHHFWDLT